MFTSKMCTLGPKKGGGVEAIGGRARARLGLGVGQGPG